MSGSSRLPSPRRGQSVPKGPGGPLLTVRAAVGFFGEGAVHAGPSGLRFAVDDVHNARGKDTAPAYAAIATVLGRDHHPTLLAIRCAAFDGGIGWPRTVAPIDITDGRLDKEGRFVPVRGVHHRIVVGVEARCSIPISKHVNC